MEQTDETAIWETTYKRCVGFIAELYINFHNCACSISDGIAWAENRVQGRLENAATLDQTMARMKWLFAEAVSVATGGVCIGILPYAKIPDAVELIKDFFCQNEKEEEMYCGMITMWAYNLVRGKQDKCVETVDGIKIMSLENCAWCNNIGRRFKVCSKCRLQRYCSKECQTADWPEHMQKCGGLKDVWEVVQKASK